MKLEEWVTIKNRCSVVFCDLNFSHKSKVNKHDRFGFCLKRQNSRYLSIYYVSKILKEDVYIRFLIIILLLG